MDNLINLVKKAEARENLRATSVLEQLISDARDVFENSMENGDWPEKWDSGKAREFLARYLSDYVVVKDADK